LEPPAPCPSAGRFRLLRFFPAAPAAAAPRGELAAEGPDVSDAFPALAGGGELSAEEGESSGGAPPPTGAL